VVVVGAAAGYPGSYDKGTALQLPPDRADDAWIIHAGSRMTPTGLVTAGGRVLGAVGRSHDLNSARRLAYDLVRGVSCDGLFYRSDIAANAVSAEG
jgi:phosphoribosylamine-glycine ligase